LVRAGRASGVNPEKVARFFDAYESVLFNDSGDAVIQPNHIFNPDEKGFTVCHTPGKKYRREGETIYWSDNKL